MVRIAVFLVGLSIFTFSGCVSVDPDTGEVLPRGKQKYEFAFVEEKARQLEEGMHRVTVLSLLGSPAEVSEDKNTWVYLPERPAVLVPSHALKLEFEGETLVKFGKSPIVLGQHL